MEGIIAIFMSLLIPIVAIAFGCWTTVNKKNRDKDIRQLLIENNVDIERAKLLIGDAEKKGNKYSYLRLGLIILGMGLGALVDYILGVDFEHAGLYPYLILVVGMGLGMLTSFVIEYKLNKKERMQKEAEKDM